MSPQNGSIAAGQGVGKRGRPRGAVKVLLPVKLTEAERHRFKIAAVEEGLSYGSLVISLLDERDKRLDRQRRAQAHPLHQPQRKSAYPGGGA